VSDRNIPSKPASNPSEHRYAEMEAARNAAEDAYFVPRHTISRTSLQEEIFRAGFERAYWPQVDRVETLKRELAEARSHHPMDSFRLALSRLSQEIERLRAALAQCYEHLDDQYKIVGIVDAALAGVPPYEFSRAADETTARRFTGVGELERSGYIPAGSAVERESERNEPVSRPVMNPPADEAEAGNRIHAAPGQADRDAACRGQTGLSSRPEARPVMPTAQNPLGPHGGVAAPGKGIPGAASAGESVDSRLAGDAPDHRSARGAEARHSERSEPAAGVSGNAGTVGGSSSDTCEHLWMPSIDVYAAEQCGRCLAIRSLTSLPAEETSDVTAERIAGGAEHRFMLWLMKEIPAGTVISSPAWWSPRIFRAVEQAMRAEEAKPQWDCRCDSPSCPYCGPRLAEKTDPMDDFEGLWAPTETKPASPEAASFGVCAIKRVSKLARSVRRAAGAMAKRARRNRHR